MFVFIKVILTVVQRMGWWGWAAHRQPGQGAFEDVPGINDSSLNEDDASKHGNKCQDMRDIYL